MYCIGEIPGTLHSRVYDEYESELIPGTVLILKKVVLTKPTWDIIKFVYSVRYHCSVRLKGGDTLI